MTKIFLYILLSSIILSGCTSKNLLEDSAVVNKKIEQKKTKKLKNYRNYSYEYRVAPHDRVSVSVYKHSELSSGNILLDSRGTAILPLVGSVRLAGLTQTQASKKVRRLYSKYLKNPDTRLEVLNKKAFIIGEVASQGVIPLVNEQISLLEAISSRGGFKDYANREKLIIIRKSGSHPKIEIVDLTNLTSLSYTNMMIRANDIIYVPSAKVKIAGIDLYPLLGLINGTLGTYVKIRDLND